jgi:uridine kinase
MNTAEFNKVIEKRIDLIKLIMLSKGKEYSTDSDKFHNFKQSVGISFHTCPEKIAWEFATKHFQSIKDTLDSVDNGAVNFTDKYIEEKIGDAINYLILIEGMLKERLYNKHINN